MGSGPIDAVHGRAECRKLLLEGVQALGLRNLRALKGLQFSLELGVFVLDVVEFGSELLRTRRSLLEGVCSVLEARG